MTTNRISQNPDDEQLVAYLDGELDADEARRLEDRLIAEGELRARLKELQHSWDLLDELPQAETDERFTTSTVSLVAMKVAEDAHSETNDDIRKRWRYGLTMICATSLTILAGFKAYSIWLDRDNHRLVRDLAIIDRVDQYQHVESLDFLRKLESDELFGVEVNEDGQ